MFVEMSFKISGLTLSNKWKGTLKIMYTKNIKNPYSMALEIPLSFSFFLVKKLTVKGIIGNTQGVKRAKNPIEIDNKIKDQKPNADHKESDTTGLLGTSSY